MAPGDTYTVAGYEFTYSTGYASSTSTIIAPRAADSRVRSDEPEATEVDLYPEKTHLPGAANADDRGRNRRRIYPRPVHRAGRTAWRTKEPGRCASTISRSFAGSGSVRSSWRSAACLPPVIGVIAGSRARPRLTRRRHVGIRGMNRFILPLAVFGLMLGLLGYGLSLDPKKVPSPLIGKPAPEFSLAMLDAIRREPAVSTGGYEGSGLDSQRLGVLVCILPRRARSHQRELARKNLVTVIGPELQG